MAEVQLTQLQSTSRVGTVVMASRDPNSGGTEAAAIEVQVVEEVQQSRRYSSQGGTAASLGTGDTNQIHSGYKPIEAGRGGMLSEADPVFQSLICCSPTEKR